MTHSHERHRPGATQAVHYRQTQSALRSDPGAEDYTLWISRASAVFFDTLPLVVIWGIAQFIAEYSPSAIGVIIQTVALIAVLGYAVWNYGYRQGTTGSSVGKSLMNFAVVSEKNGRPIGFGPSLIRQLAHSVDGLLCYVGYLFPLWDAKRQTLADKIMTTVCRPVTP